MKDVSEVDHIATTTGFVIVHFLCFVPTTLVPGVARLLSIHACPDKWAHHPTSDREGGVKLASECTETYFKNA